MSEKQIADFFVRYGTALGSGDLSGIAACYATPALVATGTKSIAITTAVDIESAFVGSFEAYEARGLVGARPLVGEVQTLADGLALVDVTWEYLDNQGGAQPGESYRYLVRLGDKPGICVVIPVLSA